MSYAQGVGTLSAGLATLAVLQNQRAGNHCGNCRYGDPGLPISDTPRPGICGALTAGRIACAKWRIGP